MLFDDWLTISKSHRYSRKEFKNGTWTDYYYDKDANFSRMTQCKGKTLKINASMTEEAIVSIAENYIKNVWIADWKAHPAKAICKELKGKKIFFKDISYEHLKKTGKNSLVGKGNRNKQNLLKHVKYLPCAKELLESNGVHTQSRYQQFSSPRKDGAVGIVYQTLSGIAPAGDNNNYVQVVVSRKKYKDGTLSDMVCISVFGSKDIKKGTDSDFKIKKSLFDNRDFGNSLACPIVDTETVPITTCSLPHNSSIVNKSVEISIVDITEGNKEEKLVQFAKALDCLSQGKKPRIKRIKADATEQLPNIIIHFRRVDKNSIVKALNGTAMVLKSSVPAKGEEFTYQCHKDMMEGINRDLASLAHKTYSFVQSYFGLPEITTMSKADMRWKGKLIYSPETGRPITQNEWKVFVDALERFMNRNYSGLGERWVLSAEAMGRLLDRMVKYQSLDSVRSTPLKGMKYGTKTYDWISDSVKNLRTTMGESLTRTQQARLEVARQSAAQRVANVKDATRNKMQQIIIDGVRDRKSKSQVSQALFDSCASMNRDMQRIADSEYQMAMDRAYIAEEVYNSTDGEKLYFQRFEMLDEHTCKKCQRLKGKIAVWSETPLPDEKVRDEYASYAIWEGKVDGDAPVDILHPWCRGSWVRWTPPAQTRHTDAYAAYMSGLNGAWDKAVKAAREEWERKGVANPTDKTPGYVDRCRELFQIFSNK